MYSRRRVLGAVPAVAATALAGCSGGSNAATIGESHTLNGLTITLAEMNTANTLTTVPDDYREDGDQGTTTADGTGEPPETTLHEAGDDSTYVVVWFTFENGTDSEKRLPAPGQQPVPLSAGNIYLTGLGQGTPVQTLEGDLYVDGEAYDSLLETVAERNWALAPGESAGGWIMFTMNAAADLSRVSVTIQADGTIARWELR